MALLQRQREDRVSVSRLVTSFFSIEALLKVSDFMTEDHVLLKLYSYHIYLYVEYYVTKN